MKLVQLQPLREGLAIGLLSLTYQLFKKLNKQRLRKKLELAEYEKAAPYMRDKLKNAGYDPESARFKPYFKDLNGLLKLTAVLDQLADQAIFKDMEQLIDHKQVSTDDRNKVVELLRQAKQSSEGFFGLPYEDYVWLHELYARHFS